MSCVADAGFSAREIVEFSALPSRAVKLFGRDGIFSTLGWYRSTVAHALPPGTRAAFIVIGRNDDILAVFPMLRGPGSIFSALTTPYTCLWQPLFADGVVADTAVLIEIARVFGKFCRGAPTIRLDGIDADAAWLPPFLQGIRKAGFLALRFGHFGNWHENIDGIDWKTYFGARPGALREAIRRRGKKLIETMGATISITGGGEALEPAIAAYEKIYAASWKEPEPFPAFNAAFMREAAQEGSLRLGILALADKPLAAQFWVVRDDCAYVLKLAHDEASRARSPGTVLTAHMIRHMLEHERVIALDFGRGDDAYKKEWTSLRRQRIGLLLADPCTVRGGMATLQHMAGKAKNLFFDRNGEQVVST